MFSEIRYSRDCKGERFGDEIDKYINFYNFLFQKDKGDDIFGNNILILRIFVVPDI